MRTVVKEIKNYRTPTRIFNRFFPAMILAYWISPYLSAFCVKKKIVPNTITIMMIPAAIFASVLFAINSIPCKIIGALFFHIWFTIDMSDGQVARYTSTFSKYGEELDYIVHHVCHIFFILSFIINIYTMHYAFSFERMDYNTATLLLACLMIFVEYSFRNECSIGALIRAKNSEGKSPTPQSTRKGLIHLVRRIIRITINSFNCIDNYVLLGSILVFIDIYLNTCVLLITTCLLVVFTMLLNAKQTIRYLVICYRGE